MESIAPSNLLPVQGAARDAQAAEETTEGRYPNPMQDRDRHDPGSFDTVFGALVPDPDAAPPTAKAQSGDAPPEVAPGGGDTKPKSLSGTPNPDDVISAEAPKPQLKTDQTPIREVPQQKTQASIAVPKGITSEQAVLPLKSETLTTGLPRSNAGIEPKPIEPDVKGEVSREPLPSEKTAQAAASRIVDPRLKHQEPNIIRGVDIQTNTKNTTMTQPLTQAEVTSQAQILAQALQQPMDVGRSQRGPVVLHTVLANAPQAEHRQLQKGGEPLRSNGVEGPVLRSSALADHAPAFAPPLPAQTPRHRRPDFPAEVPAAPQAVVASVTKQVTQPIQIEPKSAQLVQEVSKFTITNMDNELLPPLRSETIASQPTAQSQTLPVRLDAPTHIARQVAEALQNMPNRPVEISLNPEELGRVRLAMSSTEAGIIVSILTERPETMDLMRRHIANLETAFQDIGYEQIAFSFGNGENAQNGADPKGSEGAFGTGLTSQNQTDTAAQISLSLSPDAGLDLRL